MVVWIVVVKVFEVGPMDLAARRQIRCCRESGHAPIERELPDQIKQEAQSPIHRRNGIKGIDPVGFGDALDRSG